MIKINGQEKQVPLLWEWGNGDYALLDDPNEPAILEAGRNEVWLLPQRIDGKRLTPNQALARYKETHEILGKFAGRKSAEYYFKLLQKVEG
jgi:hypothetical protein